MFAKDVDNCTMAGGDDLHDTVIYDAMPWLDELEVEEPENPCDSCECRKQCEYRAVLREEAEEEDDEQQYATGKRE